MSDDVPEEVKIAKELGIGAVVPEIYKDILGPAAKELGKGLAVTAKAVNLALAPIHGLVWGSEKIKTYLTEALTKRLKDLPPDEIVTPNPSIAGPAIEALKFSGHCPELRELFANLISSSINADEANKVHPAFIEIIKQISPDEARMLHRFSEISDYPIISFWERRSFEDQLSSNQRDRILVERLESLCGDISIDNGDLFHNYFDNLTRLRLVEITLTEPKNILKEVLRRSSGKSGDNFEGFKQSLVQQMRMGKMEMGKLAFTSLGQQFVDICVKPDFKQQTNDQ